MHWLAFCPGQTGVRAAPVIRGSCARLSVFADSPKLTSLGFGKLNNSYPVDALQLRGFPITDTLLYSVPWKSSLSRLALGNPENPQKPSEVTVNASAITRSVWLYTLTQAVIYVSTPH